MVLRQYSPEFSFPAANTNEIAVLQSNAVAPYDVTLNISPFTFANQARTVSLTSVDNLSAVTFTIIGTDVNGMPQTETLSGPNANTVNSVNEYLSITSINGDAAFTNLSVGRGDVGILLPILLVPHFPYMQWAINFDVNAIINISVTGTLNRINDNVGSISEFALDASLTGFTSNVYYSSTQVVSGLIIRVNSSSGGGSFNAQFMQVRNEK